eukprot:TRINITY_DN7652_c0_g1_i2.p1 TRINITY_DN7652_c0_g1~~TRINITY_DN7652_c0_g1_i2.p1  ORF type:complete len:201 (-),score=26.45 TRINITY_DN7652_c0_g1_i2:38-640(-)
MARKPDSSSAEQIISQKHLRKIVSGLEAGSVATGQYFPDGSPLVYLNANGERVLSKVWGFRATDGSYVLDVCDYAKAEQLELLPVGTAVECLSHSGDWRPAEVLGFNDDPEYPYKLDVKSFAQMKQIRLPARPLSQTRPTLLESLPASNPSPGPTLLASPKKLLPASKSNPGLSHQFFSPRKLCRHLLGRHSTKPTIVAL